MDPLIVEMAQDLLARMQESYDSLDFKLGQIQNEMVELEETMGKLREAFDI